VDLDLARKGIVLGFAVAAPVGPIGVLVIRRSLAQGARVGLVTGLGAAASDAAYALCAGLGLAAASEGFARSAAFRFAGAAILAYLGVRTLLARPPEPTAQGDAPPPRESRTSPLAAFASTFVLTIVNPATILSFAAAFAALGGVGGDRGASLVFASSVFAGSAAWWLALSTTASALRSRVTPRAMRAVNVVSGLTVVAFAAFAAFARG
jgi:threonine/homoserine/homoserine lactone efflux protein